MDVTIDALADCVIRDATIDSRADGLEFSDNYGDSNDDLIDGMLHNPVTPST